MLRKSKHDLNHYVTINVLISSQIHQNNEGYRYVMI